MTPFFTARTVHTLARHTLCLAALVAATLPGAHAAPAQTTVENLTTPTRCAEEDNVSFTLSRAGMRRFQVEALQPSYLASIKTDITAPDFSNCNFDGGAHPTDPAHRFTPRTEVLHDGPQWRIVGMVLPTFWRPHQVPVRVGQGAPVTGIHLLQVFAKRGGEVREALVLYPADGYWRIKPLPEARFGDGVYGSSFLMGPVEQDGRPIVNIASIAITPQPLAINLRFANGSGAAVNVTEISRVRTALEVTLDRPHRGATPFAVLRSMYVTPDNADMSEVAWKTTRFTPTHTRPLPAVRTLRAADVRFGRSQPSRHNTSAPDIRFSDFEASDER